MKIKLKDLRKLIRESLVGIEPLHVGYLYHGTTKGRAEKIRKSGFSLEKIGEKMRAPMPGISTTIDREIAEEHSQIASEEFGDDPAVLTVDGRGLRIAPGSMYHGTWNEIGDSQGALERIKDSGEWDGVALFDPESGDGIEEMEVLLFNPSKIRVLSVR